jgi:hypothetical protein
VQSGTPPIEFRDIRILTLLDEQAFDSVHLIADALRVSHSMILNHLMESLGMKFFDLLWTAHASTESLQSSRMETCRALLTIVESNEKSEFGRFVPRGERRFSLAFVIRRNGAHHKRRYIKSQQQIETQKFVLTVIWGIAGFKVVDLITEQHV